ncbi:hypothetical protein DFJ74DRAFT_671538 [Hyaloraphidium curvatum]|nr:hypothetical protein DFJ74DRAFT_671538 [Hyaloraphidium curvatum]
MGPIRDSCVHGQRTGFAGADFPPRTSLTFSGRLDRTMKLAILAVVAALLSTAEAWNPIVAVGLDKHPVLAKRQNVNPCGTTCVGIASCGGIFTCSQRYIDNNVFDTAGNMINCVCPNTGGYITCLRECAASGEIDLSPSDVDELGGSFQEACTIASQSPDLLPKVTLTGTASCGDVATASSASPTMAPSETTATAEASPTVVDDDTTSTTAFRTTTAAATSAATTAAAPTTSASAPTTSASAPATIATATPASRPASAGKLAVPAAALAGAFVAAVVAL